MTGQRPIVGIVAHEHLVAKPFGSLPVAGSPTRYVELVLAAGGLPVLLPGRAAPDLLDRVDALVLTGGSDVSADRADRRDAQELAVVQAAAAAGVPLLGVCRGLQVLAVATGGTLVEDLGPAHLLPEAHHRLSTLPGSLVERVLGPAPEVSSLHHQAVAEPGPAWRPTAWAPDGVVEAIEWAGPQDWPVLGVQWHPEVPWDRTGPAVFGWLVESARRRTPALA